MKLRNKNKYIYICFLLLLILTFYSIIKEYFFFNFNAPDISNYDGVMIRNNIIFGNLSYLILKAEFAFYFSFNLPIIIILSGYDYSKIKNNLLKYNIGKNNVYNKIVRKEKIKSAVIVSLGTVLIYSIISIVSLLFGTQKETYMYDTFLNGDILEKIFGSNYGFVIFTGIIFVVSAFSLTYFELFLIDYFGFLKASLVFLGLIWIGSVLIYNFFPYFLSPMTTIMTTAYGDISLIKTILPYSTFILIYLIVKSTMSYEVD